MNGHAPLIDLLHFDFNNPIHATIVLALVIGLILGIRAIYKNIKRLARRTRRARRAWTKLAAAGLVTTGTGGTLTDAFGIPSDIAQHLGIALSLF